MTGKHGSNGGTGGEFAGEMWIAGVRRGQVEEDDRIVSHRCNLHGNIERRRSLRLFNGPESHGPTLHRGAGVTGAMASTMRTGPAPVRGGIERRQAQTECHQEVAHRRHRTERSHRNASGEKEKLIAAAKGSRETVGAKQNRS